MSSLDVQSPAQIGPYILRGVIGEGAFSIVQLAYLQSEQRYYACKIIPKSRISHNNLESRFEIEIRINQQMHHPGVVQLIDIFRDENNYYVIMEFCPNGELFQYIVDRKRLREEEAKSFIYQIFETVSYIHKLNVAHRDLKPENILIDQLGHLKISDFGLSNFIHLKTSLVSTPCGSPCYASPECLSGKPYNGKTNDIWSCGVILYTMVTGQLPWTKRNQNELFKQIRRGEYRVPDYISDSCKDLIKGLMCVDTTKRLTLEQAMQHGWFKGTNYGINNQGSQFNAKIVSLRKVDMFFEKVISANVSNLDAFRRTLSNFQLTFDKFRYLQKTNAVHPPPPSLISSPQNRIRSGMKERCDSSQQATTSARDLKGKQPMEKRKRLSEGLPQLTIHNNSNSNLCTEDDSTLLNITRKKLSSALAAKRGQSVSPRVPLPARNMQSSLSTEAKNKNAPANEKLKANVKNPPSKNYQSPRFAVKKSTKQNQDNTTNDDPPPSNNRVGSVRRMYNPGTGNFDFNELENDQVYLRKRFRKDGCDDEDGNIQKSSSPSSSPNPSPVAAATSNHHKKHVKQSVKPPPTSSARKISSARKAPKVAQ